MNRDKLKQAIDQRKVLWLQHALERMMERNIPRSLVLEALVYGDIIEEYADDRPYPSALFLNIIENEPLHVIAAMDEMSGYCYIITAYRPSPEIFHPDWRTRR